MAVKKISCILSAMALMVGLFTTNAYATDKPYTRAIIQVRWLLIKVMELLLCHLAKY